jgi:hypothetical protein
VILLGANKYLVHSLIPYILQLNHRDIFITLVVHRGPEKSFEVAGLSKPEKNGLPDILFEFLLRLIISTKSDQVVVWDYC